MKDQGIIIAKAQSGDIEAVLQICLDAFPKDYRFWFGSRKDIGRDLLIKKFRQNPKGILVAKDKANGRVLGVLDLVIQENKSRYLSLWEVCRAFRSYAPRVLIPNQMEKYHVKKDECYIDKLAVQKQYRKKGIAKMLLTEAVRIARKKKKKTVSLWVAEENHAARCLYKAFDFKKRREVRANVLERLYGYGCFYFLEKELGGSTMVIEEGFPYKGWDKCIRARTEAVELLITTEVGPRVLSFGPVGGRNVFAEYEDQLGRKGQDSWQIYGGHRLWHAPESDPRTYFPDNRPVSARILDDRIELVQETEATTKIQKEIMISFPGAPNHVRLTHKLTNRNLWPVKTAPWALSVMAKGGFAVFPQEPFVSHDDWLLPVRPLVLWAFTDMQDPRWHWGSRYIILSQDPEAKTCQKAGFANTLGWAAYVVGEEVFIKRYAFHCGKQYADLGCNTETYTDGDMLEVETLGPFEEINPSGSLIHVEDWFLFRAAVQKNEESIAEVLEPLVQQTQASL